MMQQSHSKLDKSLIAAPKSYKIVSFVILVCQILGTIIGYIFSSNNVEDTLIVIVLVMIPLFICFVFLTIWFNMKQVRILNETIIYRNMIGRINEYRICDLSYFVKGEAIIVFSGKKRVFKLSLLWENIDRLLDIIYAK